MNKFVTIGLILVILLGGSYIAWVALSGDEDGESTTTETETVSTPEPTGSVPANNTDGEVDQASYTFAEVEVNNTAESCWTVIEGTVYDITSYIPSHPGGADAITQICGGDGTALFEGVAPHQANGASSVLVEFELGSLAQ